MKSQQELLQKVQEIVSQCDRCGTCLTVCPLYGAKDVESSSARGKNNLALGLLLGVIQPTPAVQDAMNFCLLCRTCVDNCPTKVQTDEAMMARAAWSLAAATTNCRSIFNSSKGMRCNCSSEE